VIGIDDALMGN